MTTREKVREALAVIGLTVLLLGSLGVMYGVVIVAGAMGDVL